MDKIPFDRLFDGFTKKDDKIDELIKINKEKEKVIDTLMVEYKERDDLAKQISDDMNEVEEKLSMIREVVRH